MSLTVVSLLLAFAVSWVFCAFVVKCCKTRWLDLPGERSLHTTPVPRLGGVGLWAGVVAGGLAEPTQVLSLLPIPCLCAALILWLAALLDDYRSLSPATKLGIQLFASLLALYGLGILQGDSLSLAGISLLALLVLVWGINLFNFMDGMDGFAALMAITGFGCLAVIGGLQGASVFALSCGLIVVATLGFLYFNFPPAKLFMGDAGSTVLGFSMVVLSWVGWQADFYPAWVPVLLFAPFWVDASVTLLKRLLQGKRIWQPHREHHYQRWVLEGFSHCRVLCFYSGLMLLPAVITVLWLRQETSKVEDTVFVLVWVIVYTLAVGGSEKALRIRAERAAKQRQEAQGTCPGS